jgi:hypothetical protein
MEILRMDCAKNIQGVSEIGVKILASGRTCQLMKLFSIIFCKIRKTFPRFLPPNFYQTRLFFVAMTILMI